MLLSTILALSSSSLAVPSYPEGANIPKYLTKEEQRYIYHNPIAAPRSVTAPPSGPIHCVAEYEPMDGILLSWEGFSDIVA
ncbi:MAG: hypothetical protein HOC27_00615, partial [Phycisphaerae bacterium]|nr:hypothetical protein [Phycisphaerae bacterium]